MPGIVGFISKGRHEHAEAQLKRMVESMCHEPFYSAGTWIDESLGVYVGWVGREPSFAGAMPLRNESGERVLVFSGDEFPEPGTARRLEKKGHTFNSEDCS